MSLDGFIADPDDYVFAIRFGRRLDGSALRVAPASVKAAMGHSRITRSERYLYALSASELADRFTRVLASAEPAVATVSEAV